MIALILTLAFLSLIVWIIVTFIAKTEPFRSIIIAIAAICAIIYVMHAFGIADVPLPRVR
jgi:1,4-dihydroxy-2-naphthoate octaprenyltransferase